MQVQAYPGTGKGQNIAIILIVVVVLALVVYIIVKVFGGFENFFDGIKDGTKKVTDALGITDSAQESEDKEIIQTAKEQASTISSPWNPAYYQNAPNDKLLFTTAYANGLAKQIYDSVGYVTDDSAQGLAAIKQCKTKTQVSFLADKFNSLYKRDLFSFMQYYYDKEAQVSNLRAAIEYVNSLPAYKIG